MSDGVSARLAEQLAYYRARASEYDEWWCRRGRYDRGPAPNAQWFGDVAELDRALDGFNPRGKVLELAGGTGIWSEKLLRYADQLTVVDASAEVLAINKAKLRSERVRYVEANLFEWAPTDQYDVVFFAFWLSHVPESKFEQFCSLVRRALAKRGRVFFIDSRREPTSTASDHNPADKDGISLRRLNDGRTFEIYKIFYDGPALERRLSGLGWNATVQCTQQYFLYGSCVEADA